MCVGGGVVSFCEFLSKGISLSNRNKHKIIDSVSYLIFISHSQTNVEALKNKRVLFDPAKDLF